MTKKTKTKTPPINLTGLTNKGSMNEHLSVLVGLGVSETPLPSMPRVTFQQVFSQDDTETILEYALDKSGDDLKPYVDKVLKRTLATYTNEANESQLAIDPTDETETYEIGRLIFWAGTNEDTEYTIKRYMDKLHDAVLHEMETSSGDDDFYDYMPAFVDIYRQLCEYFQGPYPAIYNKLIADTFDSDPDNWEDHGIHITRIEPK